MQMVDMLTTAPLVPPAIITRGSLKRESQVPMRMREYQNPLLKNILKSAELDAHLGYISSLLLLKEALLCIYLFQSYYHTRET